MTFYKKIKLILGLLFDHILLQIILILSVKKYILFQY